MKTWSSLLRTNKKENWGAETEDSAKFRKLNEWKMCSTALPPLALEGAQGNYPMIYHHRLRVHLAELRSVLRFTSEITDQNWKMHQALRSCSIAKKQQPQVFPHFAHITHMHWKTLEEKNTFSCVPHRKEFTVEIFEKKKKNLES